jgi:hypothetical protein
VWFKSTDATVDLHSDYPISWYVVNLTNSLLTSTFDVVRSQSSTYFFNKCHPAATKPSREIISCYSIDVFDILNKQEERANASWWWAFCLFIRLVCLHTSHLTPTTCWLDDTHHGCGREVAAAARRPVPCFMTHCYPHLPKYNAHFFPWKYILKIYCLKTSLTFSSVTYFIKRNSRNKKIRNAKLCVNLGSPLSFKCFSLYAESSRNHRLIIV